MSKFCAFAAAGLIFAPLLFCGNVSAEKNEREEIEQNVLEADAPVERIFLNEVCEIKVEEEISESVEQEIELQAELESRAVEIELEQVPNAAAESEIPASVEWEWYDVVKETDFLEEPFYYDGAYALTESERDLVERTVMHEAGWCPDYRLLILTAQCIRNGCELFDQTPHETFDNFGYAAMSYANPRSKKAVSDVFDKGLKCVDDDIYCYYNSTMVASAWHETQTLSIDIDGNRFFF